MFLPNVSDLQVNENMDIYNMIWLSRSARLAAVGCIVNLFFFFHVLVTYMECLLLSWFFFFSPLGKKQNNKNTGGMHLIYRPQLVLPFRILLKQGVSSSGMVCLFETNIPKPGPCTHSYREGERTDIWQSTPRSDTAMLSAILEIWCAISPSILGKEHKDPSKTTC